MSQVTSEWTEGLGKEGKTLGHRASPDTSQSSRQVVHLQVTLTQMFSGLARGGIILWKYIVHDIHLYKSNNDFF